MQLELTSEQIRLLIEILEATYADLREEVYKTDTSTWKAALKNREEQISSLLDVLKRAATQ